MSPHLNINSPTRRNGSAIYGLIALYGRRNVFELISKAVRLWRREGLVGFLRVFYQVKDSKHYPDRWLKYFEFSYTRWVLDFDRLSPDDRSLISKHISEMARKPRISVLMPVFNTSEEYLELAVRSVQKQLYPHWELCLVVNHSAGLEIREFIDEAHNNDSRISVIYTEQSQGFSDISNIALGIVSGEFFLFLDPADQLAEHALYCVSEAIHRFPEVDFLYSDEDKINDRGQRCDPYFKPDWNPDLLFGQNFVENLSVYRTSLTRSLGGFRAGVEGIQRWDLALRITEHIQTKRIYHIPHVLYHARRRSNLDDLSGCESHYVSSQSLEALKSYWHNKGVEVRIEAKGNNEFRTHFTLPVGLPHVSVVVPTRNKVELLRCCINGVLLGTDYPNMDIVIVDNMSDDPETVSYLEDLAHSKSVHLLRYDAPFNFSAINNLAISQCNGDIICLLNNDIEPINTDWLREMVSHAVRPGVGVVGAMLYYPDDRIQHAGTLLNGIAADHLYIGFPRGYRGYKDRARCVQNLSAVTAACMVVRRNIWDELGGMEDVNLTVAFNDVDLCLKSLRKGYRNVWTPYAELYHHESASRGSDHTPDKLARFQNEIAYMQATWGELLYNDPAWSLNLALDGSWPFPASPPRADRPWLQLKDQA